MNQNSNSDRLFVVSIATITTLFVLVAALSGPAVAAQETNTTTATATPQPTATETATPEPTAAQPATESEACDPGPGEPQMDQARLYASKTTIDTDSAGQISGGFQVSPTANCPVVVVITMSVPSGMTISGGSDFASGGAGMVSTRFTVRPGANIKDIRANVYSSEVGQRTVTADIQYWPEGHQDLNREIDGLSFTFDVEAANTPSASTAADEDDSSIGDGAGGFSLVASLVAAFLVVLGLSRRSRQ